MYFDSDELIKTRVLILDLINDVKFVSNAICEILASWLIEKQNRDVESSELIKTIDLSDLNRLIDDLIELYLFASVSDVSTRIFLLIWLMSTTTMYFCSKKRNDFVLNVFNLRRFFRFDISSIAICVNSCYLINWEMNSKCRIETTDESIEFDRFDRCKIWLINKLEIINDLNLIRHRKTHSFMYNVSFFFELFSREHNWIFQIFLRVNWLDANLTKLTRFKRTRKNRFLLYDIKKARTIFQKIVSWVKIRLNR